jgi:hypothetical protein
MPGHLTSVKWQPQPGLQTVLDARTFDNTPIYGSICITLPHGTDGRLSFYFGNWHELLNFWPDVVTHMPSIFDFLRSSGSELLRSFVKL